MQTWSFIKQFETFCKRYHVFLSLRLLFSQLKCTFVLTKNAHNFFTEKQCNLQKRFEIYLCFSFMLGVYLKFLLSAFWCFHLQPYRGVDSKLKQS